ncbi:hypothetical protein QJS10_CPA09g00835 [Acorus calamus]|uniref:Uncharacterized protein n=1 Tax=Acorus calamus TaxID=4465 RepID=A0AAV9E4G7_ACOCL|nr:hypothetical protein QJS10_CPA09g00835 [Acorus calamus]
MSAPDGEVGGNSNPLVLSTLAVLSSPLVLPSSPHVAPPPLIANSSQSAGAPQTASPPSVLVVPSAPPPPRGGTIDGVLLALSSHTASKPNPGPVQDSLSNQGTAGRA